MPDNPYSLGDLARLADVTPRTIRYYVAQGLLPSPEAAGPATRYGEGHLLRLRLIKRLQRDHLPLSEIRGRLERMGDDEVRLLLEAGTVQAAQPAPAETLAFVRGLMAQTGIRPGGTEDAFAPAQHRSLARRVAEYQPAYPDSFPQPPQPGSPNPIDPQGPPPTSPQPAAPAAAPAMPVPVLPALPPGRSVTGDRSTWERLAITPDVELHVRRPLDRQSNKKVEHLIRIARELFDEAP